LYSPTDVRRLRLVRRARLLGLSLPEVKATVAQAFSSTCAEFAEQLLSSLAHQRAEVDRQIAELEALKQELDVLERHVRHSRQQVPPGQRVAECAFCPMIDEEGASDRGSPRGPSPAEARG